MGKLVVLEGLDASGKATQTRLLCEYLAKMGIHYKQVSFPDYGQPSALLAEMYLHGEMGGVDDINAYAASTFFAADRYVSRRLGWGKDYDAGAVIVADRYTTSNMSHQAAKLPRDEWEQYIRWLEDFEYKKLGLPRPDCVIFLDMHPNTSRKLLEKRYGGDASRQDIHEANLEYQLHCRESAAFAARYLGWQVVHCCDGENPFSVEDIASQVGAIARQHLGL